MGTGLSLIAMDFKHTVEVFGLPPKLSRTSQLGILSSTESRGHPIKRKFCEFGESRQLNYTAWHCQQAQED
jgi:hypothetical protein